MSRSLWFVAGAGAGVYAVIRGRRAAEALTVDGITDRLNGAALGLRLFRDEVAQGRAEKETELRDRLALAPTRTTRELMATEPTAPERSSTDEEEGTT